MPPDAPPPRAGHRAALPLALTLALAAALASGCPAPSPSGGLKPSAAPRKKASPSPSPNASESPAAEASASPTADPLAPSPAADPAPPTAGPQASLAPSPTPAPSVKPIVPPKKTPRPTVTLPFASPMVATLAGGEAGFADGAAGEARFDSPNGIDIDSEGRLYVADAGNHRIRLVTPDGRASTFAGSVEGFQDGALAEAKFRSPYGVAVAGGVVYVADTENHRIRKITLSGGVSTYAGDGTAGFADGPAATAQFNSPFSVAVAQDGSLYVADAGNRRIRKITPEGAVSTVVGGESGNVDGPLASARFAVPNDLAVDGEDGLYVVDGINHNVRYVDFKLNIVRTLAGSGQGGNVDGIGVRAKLNSPSGLAVVEDGVLVADTRNHKIRFLKKDGTLVTVVGVPEAGNADGNGATARLNEPTDLVVGPDGTAYVSDTKNARIRTLK